MNVSGSGRGCNTLTGRFLVRELVFGLAGEVISAAVDAEQHCSDLTPALFVALRYNSSVPTNLFPGDIGQYAIRITKAAQGLVTGDGISCGGFLNDCDVVFGSATTATGVNVPTEDNVQKPAPAPVAPPPEATPPRKAGDNEPESATPPPEAGKPDAGSKKGGAAK